MYHRAASTRRILALLLSDFCKRSNTRWQSKTFGISKRARSASRARPFRACKSISACSKADPGPRSCCCMGASRHPSPYSGWCASLEYFAALRYPQTRYIYHKIADRLVEAGYTVLAMDLRGYGRSSKPKASKNHVEYSKREMARDVVEVACVAHLLSFCKPRSST